MTQVTLSLISHTNAGKTTLARTLLARDIGEVRDAPHVTEFAESHLLVESAQGDRLLLWDTPGFGDSARLVLRLRQSQQPLGWLLSTVWDRWRDRPFWASQQALRHVQAESDVVLYLVNAGESPAAAGYIGAEMELLGWVGKPVLVLLNQLGPPQPAAQEAAELQLWRDHLARWPLVRRVLPLDAFARCWVHEQTLLQSVEQLLTGESARALGRLAASWLAQREATFAAAMTLLAQSLGRVAAARETAPEVDGLGQRLLQIGATLARRDDAAPAAAAQQRLAAALAAEVRGSTDGLIALHGLQGQAEGGEILGRVAAQFALREKLPEGRAAIFGGALAGALTGLKADILSGGFTLGGGLIAGSVLGALGAAGLARGVNLLRDTGQSWVAFSPEALDAAVQAALLRYLAVAHFGRGRGQWAQGEAPAHWVVTVTEVLAAQQADWSALWATRSRRLANDGEAERLAAAMAPLLARAARDALERLYPPTAAATATVSPTAAPR